MPESLSSSLALHHPNSSLLLSSFHPSIHPSTTIFSSSPPPAASHHHHHQLIIYRLFADDLDHDVSLLDRARGEALRANNRLGIYQDERGSAAGETGRRGDERGSAAGLVGAAAAATDHGDPSEALSGLSLRCGLPPCPVRVPVPAKLSYWLSY